MNDIRPPQPADAGDPSEDRVEADALEQLLASDIVAAEDQAEGIQPSSSGGPSGEPVREPRSQRFAAARVALSEISPRPSIEEKILHDLVLGELELVTILDDVKTRLGLRLLALHQDSRTAHVVARLLREVVAVDNAVARRIQDGLAAAVGIRAQRRFIDLHERGLSK